MVYKIINGHVHVYLGNTLNGVYNSNNTNGDLSVPNLRLNTHRLIFQTIPVHTYQNLE